MADYNVAGESAPRHPNAGRKQSPEHIAKRVAAIAAAKAKLSAEGRERLQRIARENGQRAHIATSTRLAAARRMSESHAAASSKPVIIYGLFDPRTTFLKYIGKTSASLFRRLAGHDASARRGKRNRLYNWWRGLLALGLRPEAEVIEVVPPKGDWPEAEKFWISYFRFIGCDLANLCDGGVGTDGLVFSQEHLNRLALARTGRKLSAEHRAKIGLASRRAWASKPKHRKKPDTLAKSLATKAVRRAAGLYKERRPATEETKAKISAGKRGKPLTEEHKAKLSAIRKGKQIGRVMSDASRAKMSAAHIGVPLGAAHREAITIGGRKMRAAKTTANQ